ncbi:MAG: TIGR04133 family radical SAM/SPASM protein [Prevotella sp.]|nr:TIGR04133 family radical SAM/SPASM protein [Prevotella sp.]
MGLETARRIQLNLAKEHPLRQLFWESTLRCNLHCRHCGSDCKALPPTMGKTDMPREDFFGVLDSIAAKTDAHGVFVIVSGGEPLMRSDIVECGQGIYERGFPWGMVSNGLALTADKLQALLAAGMHSMTISIDGLRENHNWMRGHELSFDRVDRAIGLLAGVKNAITADGAAAYPYFRFDVVTCVTEHNYGELAALREYLIDKGVRAWRLFTVFPVGRAATDPDLQLSNEHLRGLMAFIRDTRREGRIKASYGCEGFLGTYESEVRDGFFFCRAGVLVGSVLVDGNISACTSIRSDYVQGNIYRDDFMDVWEQRFGLYRNREWMHRDECGECEMWRYCRGNGMHLRDDKGQLLTCHLQRLSSE